MPIPSALYSAIVLNHRDLIFLGCFSPDDSLQAELVIQHPLFFVHQRHKHQIHFHENTRITCVVLKGQRLVVSQEGCSVLETLLLLLIFIRCFSSGDTLQVELDIQHLCFSYIGGTNIKCSFMKT